MKHVQKTLEQNMQQNLQFDNKPVGESGSERLDTKIPSTTTLAHSSDEKASPLLSPYNPGVTDKLNITNNNDNDDNNNADYRDDNNNENGGNKNPKDSKKRNTEYDSHFQQCKQMKKNIGDNTGQSQNVGSQSHTDPHNILL